MLDRFVLGNGTLGKHVGKAFQLVFFVQNFQRGQQIVAVILPEHLRIAPVRKQAELTGKDFVALLQFKLQTADSSIRSTSSCARINSLVRSRRPIMPRMRLSSAALSSCFSMKLSRR